MIMCLKRVFHFASDTSTAEYKTFFFYSSRLFFFWVSRYELVVLNEGSSSFFVLVDLCLQEFYK